MTGTQRETALARAAGDSEFNLDTQAYRNLAAWIEGSLRKLTHEYEEFITPESRQAAARGNRS